jgi:hypothetical protein
MNKGCGHPISHLKMRAHGMSHPKVQPKTKRKIMHNLKLPTSPTY